MRNREESPKSNRNKLPATTGICRNIRNNISGNVNGNNSLNNISSNNSKKNKTDKNSKNSKSNNNISHNHNQTPYWGNLTWLWQQPVRCKQRNIEHNHRNVKNPAFPNIICLASEVRHMGSHQYTDVKAPTHHESITESQQSRATRAFRKWQQTNKRRSIINIIVEAVKFQNLAARCIHRC